MYATDASTRIGGICVAPVSPSTFFSLYDLREERGELVQLDRDSQPPESDRILDHRAAAVHLACPLDWTVDYSYVFPCPLHINLLELDVVYRLICRLKGQAKFTRIICLVDSRVVLGAIAKGRSSSRKINYRLRKLFAVAISKNIYLDICWLPTWGNPADCPTRDYSIEHWRDKLPILPSASPSFAAHVDAAAELALLDGPYPSAAEAIVPPKIASGAVVATPTVHS
jgi:hypothetical protein